MGSPTPTPEVEIAMHSRQTQSVCNHQNGRTSTGFEGFSKMTLGAFQEVLAFTLP